MRSIFLLLSVIFTAQSLFGQTLSPAEAREDLRFFRKKMAAWYPGIGYYSPADFYEKKLDELDAELTQPIDYQLFYKKMGVARSILQDGHFGIYHRKNFFPKNPKLLPFQLRVAEGKYWVIFDLTADSSLHRGAEILAIDDRPIRDIHDLLTDQFRDGNDGPTENGARTRTMLAFAGFYADWFGPRDSVEICFKTTDSSAVECRFFACPTAKERNTTLAKRYPKIAVPKPNLAFEMVDSMPKTAVLYVSSFGKLKKRDLFNLGFAFKTKRVFRQAKKNGVENLVIDLRNNGGGAVINSARLLKYLIPEPFGVFGDGQLKRRAIWPYSLKGGPPPFGFLFFFLEHKKDKNTGGWRDRRPHRANRKPHKSLIFSGKTWFLINGASFSAAVTVPAICRSHGVGKFVGEPTGGAYWGDFAARFKTITLPNSKIRVRIPLKKLDHAVDPSKNKTLLIEPDFFIERKKSDVMEARDFVMPAVMDLIKKG